MLKQAIIDYASGNKHAVDRLARRSLKLGVSLWLMVIAVRLAMRLTGLNMENNIVWLIVVIVWTAAFIGGVMGTMLGAQALRRGCTARAAAVGGVVLNVLAALGMILIVIDLIAAGLWGGVVF